MVLVPDLTVEKLFGYGSDSVTLLLPTWPQVGTEKSVSQEPTGTSLDWNSR
jgi:hypothetical protein